MNYFKYLIKITIENTIGKLTFSITPKAGSFYKMMYPNLVLLYFATGKTRNFI